jgi:hypothetical protein
MTKQDTVLNKITVRKHLNADALFSTIRGRFEKIPDFRSEQKDIRLSDALMSAFAMFSLKDSSLLSFDNRRKDAAECQNLGWFPIL